MDDAESAPHPVGVFCEKGDFNRTPTMNIEN